MSYQPMTQMQGKANLRFVLIPEFESRAEKGKTKYDDWFFNCVENNEAIQIPEDEFEAVKKAAFRFMKYNNLSLSVKQKKDARSKSYILWFKKKDTENE